MPNLKSGQVQLRVACDRDASVLEPALLRPPRGPARLALRVLNLGIVELLEVRLDNRAVELPADAAEVGEDGRQAPQRRTRAG